MEKILLVLFYCMCLSLAADNLLNLDFKQPDLPKNVKISSNAKIDNGYLSLSMIGRRGAALACISWGEILAHFNNMPCVVRKDIGKGTLFYAGTQLGYTSEKGDDLFTDILTVAAQRADIPRQCTLDNLHVDKLYGPDGEVSFLICSNIGKDSVTINFIDDSLQEIFGFGKTLEPQTSRFYVKK